MERIIRGTGTTPSERYLAKLADKTFLDLWSYPNTFIDKRSNPNGTGKELCDLLVVCGDNVVVFSDKQIAWGESQDINLAWSRWYRKAVVKSVDQIRGADRWIRKFPNRIYLDPACTQKLPLSLPPLSALRVHGVAVALGAREACARFNGGGDGSLMINGLARGSDHTNPTSEAYWPFSFGDVDPLGPFVHVFDETALDLVLGELDTVSDFVRYLVQREKVIRSSSVITAASEADMLAIYLQTLDFDEEHSFPLHEDGRKKIGTAFAIPPGEYSAMLSSDHYAAKREADRISYNWDRLIRVFTEHVLAGTSVALAGEAPETVRAEPALRIMALENRMMRRALGQAFTDALFEARRQGQDRFARIVLPKKRSFNQRVAYVFLILAYPKDVELTDGYDQYRRARVAMLEAYCYTALYDNRSFNRIVGIAADASSEITEREGHSEDLIAIEVDEWTIELERRVEDRRKEFDIMLPERLRIRESSLFEYPDSNVGLRISRRQRRAMKARNRKKTNLRH